MTTAGTPFLLLWFLCILVYLKRIDCYPNNGPFPKSFDCPMRELALSFAQYTQPFLTSTQLQDLVDALNGSPEAQNCNLSIATAAASAQRAVQGSDTHVGNSNVRHVDNHNDIGSVAIFVDPIHGLDDDDQMHGAASKERPFRTIQFALDFCRIKYGPTQLKTIYLRGGKYYLQNAIQLNANDSNLILRNYARERVEISGAIPLLNLEWHLWQNQNSNENNLKYYVAQIPMTINITTAVGIPGLRVNSRRGIRARYPNCNPETDGFGSTLNAQAWLPPISLHPQPDILIRPSEPFRNDSYQNQFAYYTLGIGGDSCEGQFAPPAGFWCTDNNGRSHPYYVPSGLKYNSKILPNSTMYKDIGASVLANNAPLINAYANANHWGNWVFEIGSNNKTSQEFVFSKGGFQTAQGSQKGGEFYIENILEELDFGMEYYYDPRNRSLYYVLNGTDSISNISDLKFEATNLKVLMNLTGVRDVLVDGLIFRDTSVTYLDAHGMCSGGDLTYPRSAAALMLYNSENVTISNNLFTRIDGNCILMNHYNQGITVFKNEFVWIGNTPIVLWGDTIGITFDDDGDTDANGHPYTMGWDGTTLAQPQNINISFNFAHEFGVFMKESSFYFQAKSYRNYVGYNIIFNAPRFGINFNDGFGGGNVIEKNLMFNTCRESGHGNSGTGGPFNSWDRQPYVTKRRDGSTSVIKDWDTIHANFLIANYFGMFAVNMDDGSSYFNITNNLLVYAEYGLKTSYGGHDGYASSNIYAYVGVYCFWLNAFHKADTQLPGHVDLFADNTCIVSKLTMAAHDYAMWNCQMPRNEWPLLKSNTVYTVDQSVADANVVGLCNVSESNFQTQYNNDIGTKIYGPNQLNNSDIVQQAKQMLFQQ